MDQVVAILGEEYLACIVISDDQVVMSHPAFKVDPFKPFFNYYRESRCKQGFKGLQVTAHTDESAEVSVLLDVSLHFVRHYILVFPVGFEVRSYMVLGNLGIRIQVTNPTIIGQVHRKSRGSTVVVSLLLRAHTLEINAFRQWA